MRMKILFSPIGNTDPIKYFRDGSMLHICRHYLPDVVYLYLSKEMVRHQEEDGRYTFVLEKLAEMTGHPIEVRLIRREELTEAQNYDYFYKDFREELARIASEYPHEELLLNMASGTPAMKSALLLLATLNEYKYHPVQVHSPKKRSNEEHDDREGEAWSEIWEINEDNEEGAENRCEDVRCMNLMYLLKVDSIRKFIQKYDYTAALMMADEIRDDISPDAYRLLSIAKARLMLDQGKIKKLDGKNEFDIFPVKESRKKLILEYALVLQVKIEKEEYVDFVRGMTPLIVNIMEILLDLKTGYASDSLIAVDARGRKIWNEETLRKTGLKAKLDLEYKDGFKGGIIYSNHILNILKLECTETDLLAKLERIAGVEKDIRNVAAHEIRAVTAEQFHSVAGCSVQDVFSDIKFIMQRAGIIKDQSAWNSYKDMNDKLLKLLQ